MSTCQCRVWYMYLSHYFTVYDYGYFEMVMLKCILKILWNVDLVLFVIITANPESNCYYDYLYFLYNWFQCVTAMLGICVGVTIS